MRPPLRLVLGFVLALLATGCGDGAQPVAPSPAAPGPVNIETLTDVPVSDPIADVTAGSVGTFNYPGQSVTIPVGTYDHLRFQWYSYQRTATAFGRLYLLDQEYLGLPAGLPAAAGLVATTSTIEEGEFVFDAAVEIVGGRTYWFYADKQGSFAHSFDIDTYAGGIGYVTGIASQPFRRTLASARMVNGILVPPPPGVTTDQNFRLRGAKQ